MERAPWCQSAVFALLVLALGRAPEALAQGAESTGGDDAERPETAEQPAALKELEKAFPDLVTASLGIEELVAEIVRRKSDDLVTLAGGRKVPAVLLAAEVYESIGNGTRARELWVRGTRLKDPGHRVMALHALGMHYLIRRRYADAWKYWQALPAIAPDHGLTKRAARYTPFLRLATDLKTATLDGKVVEALLPAAPEFAGDFRKASGEPGPLTGKQLVGSWVVLRFWSSAAPGALAAERRFHAAVASAQARGWSGVILGVNLDASRDAFEKARDTWLRADVNPPDPGEPAIPWPQHHDGKGFESPIVRAFGVPRVPMTIAIDPKGRVRYFSRPGASLDAVLTRP